MSCFGNYGNKLFSGSPISLGWSIFVSSFVTSNFLSAPIRPSSGIAIKEIMFPSKCVAPDPSWPIRLLSSKSAFSGCLFYIDRPIVLL